MILTVVFLITGMVAGCKKADSPVLASYSGGKVTEKDFTEAITRLPESIRAAAAKQPAEFLDSLVSEKLLLMEAETKGIQHDQEVKDLIRQSRDRILVTKLLDDQIGKQTVIEDRAVRAYYDTHADEFKTPYRLRASHILVRTRDEAQKLLGQIQQGESFEELAKMYSLDPTGAKGGDIGYFQKGQLIPEVEEATFALKQGEISPVVQSSFGFHIIKLTGEAKSQVKSFEQVADSIRDKLTIEKRTELLDALIGRLKKQARLTTDSEAVQKYQYQAESNEN
ncbi:MAG: peptidylprolyl isomerase [Candidatus Omnitrophica bacterium]|nr:peptidylprolyl isomerase [Candidatus Omnitrophota bacterium]